MLNIDEINNTIMELENSDTTYDTCFKLAALYAVKDYFDRSNAVNTDIEEDTVADDVVISEYQDILPEYRRYLDIKRDYQLGNIAEKAVETQMKKVCDEISEFLHALYTGTDMPIERDYIKSMVGGLQNL